MIDRWIRRLRADPSDEEAVVRIVSELIRLNRLLELGDYVSLEQLHDAGLVNDEVYEIGKLELTDLNLNLLESKRRVDLYDPAAEDMVLMIACLAARYPLTLRLLQPDHIMIHPLTKSLIKSSVKHLNRDVRYNSLKSVSEFRYWNNLNLFIDFLNDPDVGIASEAAYAISWRDGSEKAMHALITGFNRKNNIHFLEALHSGKGQWDVSPAIELADEVFRNRNHSREMRQAAIYVLNNLTDGEYDQLFLEILFDPTSDMVKFAAADSLKSPESIPAIGTLLQQDINWRIRRNLLECLSNMRSIRAFPFLFLAAQGDDDQLAEIAQEGLYRLGINSGGRARTNALVNARSACRNDPDPVIREAAMRLSI